MLAGDFLADRQPDPCSPGPLRALEQVEQLREQFGGDTRPVVFDGDPDQPPLGLQPRRHVHPRPARVADRVERVPHQVQHRAMDRLGVEQHLGQVGLRPPRQGDAQFFRLGLQQFTNLGDRGVQRPLAQLGLPFLGESQQVEHQLVDPLLVPFDNSPSLADQLFLVPVEPHVDEVAPPANPLQDVLDVMAQDGGGLPDRGQPFRFDQRLLVVMVFDRQGRLPADRHHQPQQVFREPGSGPPLKNHPVGRSGDIEIQHPLQVVAALHGNADGLADPGGQHALGGGEPAVAEGVAGAHPLPAFEHVVDNAPRDRHRPGGRVRLPPVDKRRRPQRPPTHRSQQHAAPVGPGRLEGQLKNPPQQRVERGRRPHRFLGNPIQHLQTGDRLAGLGQRVACLGGPDNLVGTLHLGPFAQHHPSRQVARGGLGHQEPQHCPPGLDLIPMGQHPLADWQPVDVGPVRAAQVEQHMLMIAADHPGMKPRRLGVAQANAIAKPPPQPGVGLVEFKPLALIGPLNHQQRGRERHA